MRKAKPPQHCGISKKQLVHFQNDYGHILKKPAHWDDIRKIWVDDRGDQVLNVVDFEPMVLDWDKPVKKVGV